ncbi:hypothetical protein AAA799E16_01158 [Marine Group I thaumarchaeote SCGC AAA799-E16]|uniref:Uncharacterized protein n=5 Tax=Marine Group I TaxID=905826 RepID=A0A087S6I0_9ARCH|nr:hypothetical protein AAA799N04_00889 [Marine Group I thaumarchaeote SCGC AAA799-N04]KER06148.1 hypothetical protein AAA799E16_01158 [Marine Group I thaumarchaeote SCGC AAA799-E16]KFM15884.1 hypothetical protein AAA799D11_01042 [Marine Group I thaumarchaeote SCGC AAA799-D11]KFM17449.1 hypothetical protein SCCGRSA3_01917 [Marine Group I thaumarchaeote SCGC RSA3]KFM21334.1 hypothetical protein AAA799B03_01109 [Marine Group I thaumarchaeote SCGC AAA799-B03]
MKEPHNHAKVGYGMIAVSASLALIALMALFMADDVLFADRMQRENTVHFNECKANDFKTEGCEKYWDRINNQISGIYVELDE